MILLPCYFSLLIGRHSRLTFEKLRLPRFLSVLANCFSASASACCLLAAVNRGNLIATLPHILNLSAVRSENAGVFGSHPHPRVPLGYACAFVCGPRLMCAAYSPKALADGGSSVTRRQSKPLPAQPQFRTRLPSHLLMAANEGGNLSAPLPLRRALRISGDPGTSVSLPFRIEPATKR